MARGVKTGGGSRKGKPNKATADVRAAIAGIAEGMAHKVQGWIEQVAEGHGGRQPDPARAAELYLRAIEYHIPKLARSEVVGDGGGPVVLQVTSLDTGLL
jgi:hypothetical protein